MKLLSKRLQVRFLALLSELRIWYFHELCWRSQMWLRSGIAVAMAQASSYSSSLTPGLGTSICHIVALKRQKTNKQTTRRSIWTSPLASCVTLGQHRMLLNFPCFFLYNQDKDTSNTCFLWWLWDGKCPVIEHTTFLQRCLFSSLSSLLDYELLEDNCNFSGQQVKCESCWVQGIKWMWNTFIIGTNFQPVSVDRIIFSLTVLKYFHTVPQTLTQAHSHLSGTGAASFQEEWLNG